MVKDEPLYGGFRNGIPFVQFGLGTQDLLLFFTGPGNEPPRGTALDMVRKSLGILTSLYRIHVVTRKSDLSEGYTTRDMSNDYAEMIEESFNGKVDLVIGLAYGGLIAQHFAADHSDLFDHIVIAMTAHKLSPEGIELHEEFADLLSRGKYGDAYKALSNGVYGPGTKRTGAGSSSWDPGSPMPKSKRESFASDVLIEANAEKEHNSTQSLPRIKVPVLIISGDRDFYFPIDYVREMERMIPQSIVRVYSGRGHDAFGDKRFPDDVVFFAGGRLKP
jgi:pimeloyl-ACP methyl ester carboxylesterase